MTVHHHMRRLDADFRISCDTLVTPPPGSHNGHGSNGGLEPTYSMRTSRHGRLLTLIPLVAEESRRSVGLSRWRVRTVVESTADALRTLTRFSSSALGVVAEPSWFARISRN